MEKKTPLYDCHLKLGGKMVPFAGYILPVQYETGVIAEHMAVRTKAGLFDVSHMGEVLITGKDAFSNLQMLLTNDMTGLADGRVRYSPMCNENGGVVDDLIACRYNEEKYLLVINAANREKDVEWIKSHLFGEVKAEDISDGIAQIALQGPKSKEILSKLVDAESLPKKYYSFKDQVDVGGIMCLVSQTGYTGESGFELYCDADQGAALWEMLLDAGKDEGLIPCGLGARDTLRLEASMPLYGHEMNDVITPLETGLGMFVKMGKEDFIGKKAMLEKGEPKLERIGLEMVGRGIARENCPVYLNGEKIGDTTSGTHCPYLNKAVAMALVQKGSVSIDTHIDVEVRGRMIEAKVIPLPFYKKA